jgi:hypothetical protein
MLVWECFSPDFCRQRMISAPELLVTEDFNERLCLPGLWSGSSAAQRSQTESGIETRSLPTLTRSYPRRFTFYVADPSAPLKLVRLPCSLACALAA